MNTAENRKTNDDERLALELPTQTEALEENRGPNLSKKWKHTEIN